MIYSAVENIKDSIQQKSYLDSEPVTAFLTQRLGSDVYILADGAHRVAAQLKLDKPTVLSVVIIVPPGTDLTAWHFTNLGGSANSVKADTAQMTFVSKLLTVLPILEGLQTNKNTNNRNQSIDTKFLNAASVSSVVHMSCFSTTYAYHFFRVIFLMQILRVPSCLVS